MAAARGVAALMNMWTYGILLALLLFWAVGAYNRLIRLRSAALQAFGALEAHWQRWPVLVAEYQANHAGTWGDDRGAECNQLTALSAAASQFAASLRVARTKPLDADVAAALSTAEQVLDTAWQAMARQAACASADMAPPTLAPWLAQCEQLARYGGEARLAFNTAVAGYNHAITQFPANLLAWVFGLKPGRAL